MSNVIALKINLKEMQEITGLTLNTLLEIVTNGIVEAQGHSQEQWLFDRSSITVVKKAYRLHNDLDIEWAGIALAMDLLNEMEHLRSENRMLKQRLRRFHSDDNSE